MRRVDGRILVFLSYSEFIKTAFDIPTPYRGNGIRTGYGWQTSKTIANHSH